MLSVGKAVLNIRIVNVLMLTGIILGIVGCFLPWGRHNPSMYYPWQDVRVGTWIFSGIYTFVILMFAAAFQLVFMIKKKLYMVFPVLVAVLIALFISVTWVQEPVALEYGSDGSYTVLYGVYVTLLGVTSVAIMAILHLTITAEKQLRLDKSHNNNVYFG
jgi:hypothetical protein